jgi:hypothetical protein
LREDLGDPKPDEFQVDGNFKFIAVSEVPDVSGLLGVGGGGAAAAADAEGGGGGSDGSGGGADDGGDGRSLASSFVQIRVGNSADRGQSGDSAKEAEDAALAAAIGVKNVKRNSKELVEASFDGDMEEVAKWVDQGYSADSCDGRGHSAISEAACQGHDEVREKRKQQKK